MIKTPKNAKCVWRRKECGLSKPSKLYLNTGASGKVVKVVQAMTQMRIISSLNGLTEISDEEEKYSEAFCSIIEKKHQTQSLLLENGTLPDLE